jgi:hypothetical protein
MPKTGGDLLHGRRIPRRSARSRVRFTAGGVRTNAEPSTASPHQAELEHMRDAVTSPTAGVRLKRAVVESFPCLAALTPEPRSTPDPKARL